MMSSVKPPSLETTERLVVIFATVLALFPFWQWYSEREDRRLGRVAGLVQAVSVCYSAIDPFNKMPKLNVLCSEANGFMLAEVKQELKSIKKLGLPYLKEARALTSASTPECAGKKNSHSMHETIRLD